MLLSNRIRRNKFKLDAMPKIWSRPHNLFQIFHITSAPAHRSFFFFFFFFDRRTNRSLCRETRCITFIYVYKCFIYWVGNPHFEHYTRTKRREYIHIAKQWHFEVAVTLPQVFDEGWCNLYIFIYTLRLLRMLAQKTLHTFAYIML